MNAADRPVVVKLSSPPDIVGAVPSLLGFHPAQSLVVMCLRGPRKRTGLTMRIDLIDARYDEYFAAETTSRVAKDDADAAILVCYTSADDEAGRLPRASLVEVLTKLLLRRGIAVAEALLVRGDRWYSYSCTQPCCPPDGTSIPAGPTDALTRLGAERVLRGMAVLPTREALEASVRGPVALRRISLEQTYDRVGDAVVEEMATDGPDAFRQHTVALARGAFDRFADGERSLDDDEAARIVLGLHDKLTRDEITTWGLDGRTDELLAFLTELAQRTVDPDSAPICTVLASVSYQEGNGALASVALNRALRSDPGYEMARLLAAMLGGQLPPARLRAVIRDTRRELRRQFQLRDPSLRQ